MIVDTVDLIKEYDFERLTEKFKKEVIDEWDKTSGRVYFPLFIMVEMRKKWMWHSLLN